MIELCETTEAAVAGISDGATVLVGGFGTAGQPMELIDALRHSGVGDLTVVSNNAGNGDHGLAALLKAGQVAKVICSFPRQSDSWVFDELYRAGRIELEVVPQGTLAERLRAGGAGIEAFFTPTGFGTKVAEGKETREINGKRCVLEHAIRGDFAIVKAWKGDAWGNLVFRRTSRNFNPLCAQAGKITVVEVEELVPVGALDPDQIHLPSIYVQRIFQGTSYEKPIEQRTVRPRGARS